MHKTEFKKLTLFAQARKRSALCALFAFIFISVLLVSHTSFAEDIHYYSVNSTATGTGSNYNNNRATGDNAMAIGPWANAQGSTSIAVGYDAIASAPASIAAGYCAKAQAIESIAIGSDTHWVEDYGIVGTTASGYRSVAVGAESLASASGGVALGSGSVASRFGGTSGYDPAAGGTSNETSIAWKSTNGAVSVGSASESRQITGVAAGTSDTDAVNVAQLKQLVAEKIEIINKQHYYSVSSTVTGDSSNYDNDGAIGPDAVAIGPNAEAQKEAVVIGPNTEAYEESIAAGYGAQASAWKSVAVGYGAKAGYYAEDEAVTAVGGLATATGPGSTALGYGAKAENGTALGSSAQARNWSTAVGNSAVALGDTSTAIAGSAYGDYSTAIKGVASGDYSLTAGYGASALVAGGVALGKGSVASTAAGMQGYDPATGVASTNTGNAWKSTAGAVSVGSETESRQITGVAAGMGDTDAVNVAQLKASQTHYYSVNSAKSGNYDNDGAAGTNAVAIGPNALASGNYSLAAGYDASASNLGAVAIGNYADASGEQAMAFGTRAAASGDYSLSAGYRVGASGLGAAAIGNYASAAGERSTAFGNKAVASGNYSLAAGYQTSASGLGSAAIGNNSGASGERATAFGNKANASGNYSMASGYAAVASGDYSLSAGYQTSASGLGTAAIGNNSSASGERSTAFGNQADASGNYSLAAGYKAEASDLGAAAIGNNASASGERSTAFGNGAEASGSYSLAAGWNAQAGGRSATAFGSLAQATANYSVAIGRGSIADRLTTEAGVYIPTGSSSTWNNAIKATVKGSYGVVSIGNSNMTRQLTGVAAGIENTDAVNVAQLRALSARVNTIASSLSSLNAQSASDMSVEGTMLTAAAPADADDEETGTSEWTAVDDSSKTLRALGEEQGGQPVYEKITVTGDGNNIGADMGGSRVTNVAAGGIYQGSTDVVNGDQLWNAYQRIDEVQEDAYRAGAHAAALSALHPVAYDPYRPTTISAGLGFYHSKQSVAVGLFHYVKDSVLLNAGVSLNGDGDAMGRVGISFAMGKGGRQAIVPVKAEAMQKRITELEESVEELKAQVRMLTEALSKK